MKDIKPGDKCYTRGGDVLVARIVGMTIFLGPELVSSWRDDGSYENGHSRNLDIIKIGSSPESWERVGYVAVYRDDHLFHHSDKFRYLKIKRPEADKYLKLTIRSDGKHSVEEV
jgi:hypothetical protein